MDVQVDGELIRSQREKRAWSKEHFAAAAGIGVRTVQRIEATGVASYESARAIAAALEMSVAALRVDAAARPPSPVADADVAASGAKRHVLDSAARWLSATVAVALLLGVGGFLALHDYQKVRVLRTVEQWVTDSAQTAANRLDGR